MWEVLQTPSTWIKNAYLRKLGDYSVPTHWGNHML